MNYIHAFYNDESFNKNYVKTVDLDEYKDLFKYPDLDITNLVLVMEQNYMVKRDQ